MTPRKPAYVTGDKTIGYRIVLSVDAYDAGYGSISVVRFRAYRPAQNIANAINAINASTKQKA